MNLTTKPDGITFVAADGGSCGGKSTMIAMAVSKMPEYGIPTLMVPEVATQLFSSGFDIKQILGDQSRVIQFQKQMINAQINFENMYLSFLSLLPGDKKLCITDRGRMSGAQHVEKEIFEAIMHDMGYKISDMRDCYDAVFHIQSAAIGAEVFYNYDNTVRYETLEEAQVKDIRARAAWLGHEHLYPIENRDIHGMQIDFETKKKNFMKALFHALHIPAPLEIERKFLLDLLVKFLIPRDAVCANIEQYYLLPATPAIPNTERRIRRKTFSTDSCFFYTEKKSVRPGVRLETEKIISALEYRTLLKEINPECVPIHKTRHSFVSNGQYCQIDVFTEPLQLVVLECELSEETAEFRIPDFLKLFTLKEVTDDKRYSNAIIARKECPGYR